MAHDFAAQEQEADKTMDIPRSNAYKRFRVHCKHKHEKSEDEV